MTAIMLAVELAGIAAGVALILIAEKLLGDQSG
jgi:hypothetical protein